MAPGESGTLNVTTHMGEGMGGPHEFRITVESDDPAAPTTEITVTARFGGLLG